MNEHPTLTLRYAIEHGLTQIKRTYQDDSLVAKARRAISRNDLEADGFVEKPVPSKALGTIAELIAEAPCTGNHGDRMPAVCCEAADAIGERHPWEAICVDSEAYGPGCGEYSCAREGCPDHHDHRPPAEA